MPKFKLAIIRAINHRLEIAREKQCKIEKIAEK